MTLDAGPSTEKDLDIHEAAPLIFDRRARVYRPTRRSSGMAGPGFIISHRPNPMPRGEA